MILSNKKNIIAGIVITGLIIAVFFYITHNFVSFSGNKIKRITIGSQIFYAEVVSSENKIQKGLGGRNSLCQSCAMLFQFSSPRKYAFWMKNMRFPLDIIWILDGKIVYMEKNVSEKFFGVLVPTAAADQVLEINSGISDQLGLKIGDAIK